MAKINSLVEYQEGMAFLRHFSNTIVVIHSFLIPLTIAGFAIKVKDNQCSVIIVGITSISIWIIFLLLNVTFIRWKAEEVFAYVERLQSNESGRLAAKIKHAKINLTHFLFIVGAVICLLWGLRFINIYSSSFACSWNCFYLFNP